MSTRCTIKVEGFEYAKVYKHWDGYPEAMTEWLTSFNQDFTKNRGADPDYKFAQLLRHSVQIDDSPYTGWGVVGYWAEMGQEYEYTLKKDGTVSVEEL